MPRRRYDPSVDRQRLEQLANELAESLRRLCDHRPVVQGGFQLLRRRCGKKGCRCARGKPHETAVFVEREGGRRRVRKLRVGEEQKLKRPVARYQAIRKLRAQISSIHRQILACCDRLSEYRIEEGRRMLERGRRR
jgi:hypothetical protein